MHAASDIAEWWDEQRRTSTRALDELVDAYPNWFGVVVAGSVATAMDLGAGVVDVLRLGEGAAEGGVKGVARDALRLLQVAPAAGKLSRYALARVMVDQTGDICTWMSAAKALRQVGAKAFASVDDLAQAAGFTSIKLLPAVFVDTLVPMLQKFGARVTRLGELKSLEAVNAAVKRDGVVLFSVQWGPGRGVGHTLYAFRDSAGRLLYADRSGAVVKSLQELDRLGYAGIAGAKVYGSAALVEGPRMLIVEGLAVLAMEVRAQLAVNPETAAQTLEIKKTTLANTTTKSSTKQHVVQRGDSLSKLAKQYYGDMFKWPVLYEANRELVGRNPDLIQPGQSLLVPSLPNVSAKAQRPSPR
jgi:nucleoid-associated protein YgaU